jgi:hypothetical protein
MGKNPQSFLSPITYHLSSFLSLKAGEGFTPRAGFQFEREFS